MAKKSVSGTNEKVSNYIHDDIVFSILSKLPLKSLKRFGCVRKSWSLLFENPLFMNMFRNNFLSKDTSYCHNASFLLQRRIPNIFANDLHSLSGERFENRVELNLPDPFQDDDLCRLYLFDILNVSSTNEFICVCCHLRDKRFALNVIPRRPLRRIRFGNRFALWNPTTDEFKVIPQSPAQFKPFATNVSHDVINFNAGSFVYGFGYDRVIHDYKVLHQVQFSAPLLFPDSGYVPLENISLEPVWEIYSLRSNSWRKLDIVMPTTGGFDNEARVSIDGVCHWWSWDNTGSFLVSFDLSNEVFCTTPIPADIGNNFDNGCLWRHLVVLNGSIALVTYQTQMTLFNISILGELSVKESWIKLFIVGPLPCIEFPFGVVKGKIFFVREDKEIAWFDLSTQMIEELGVKAESGINCHIVIYWKNFLPIDGINK
ncbi:F-box/kelch-repeat protein At3g06240-like [Trifolium pratense]|uniref:F-box/kelch-repeat protein At3g06240-like n=1 Tax=Trifolium pratense TaxID=57577 RepID=UPI001E692291|nr:F-box/kelch-repeat protein At3g06240-like [Trifolium pratense]